MVSKYVCECPDSECHEEFPAGVYEAGKADRFERRNYRLGIVLPGHAKGHKIVASGEGYELIDYQRSAESASNGELHSKLATLFETVD